MSHPLVVGLFPNAAAAAAAARGLHDSGVGKESISVVARSHQEEGALAEQMDATPGADIEDSRPAAVLGELGAQVLAAIALVLPGVGPIVTAGPLSAGLGEAAGHAAGGMAGLLASAGVPDDRAAAMQTAVEEGAVLLAVHSVPGAVAAHQAAMTAAGARELHVATWPE